MAPTKRKKKPAEHPVGAKLVLEKIIGTTASRNTALSSNPVTGDLAYVAGCVVVIYNYRRNKQVKFLGSKNNKSLSCVAFSPDGKCVAAGEYGHVPAVLVWDLETGQLQAELKSHKYGVISVAFSPNMKYLVSVGFQHDQIINVWDWKNNTVACSSKLSAKISSTAWSPDSAFFVTVGQRHVKFWTLFPSFDGKVAMLGSQKESTFLDVAVSAKISSEAYVVTDKGLLCLIGAQRAIEKWVDLKTSRVFAISVTDSQIACACADGVVRLFRTSTLEYIATLPKPPPLGSNLACAADVPSSVKEGDSPPVFPDSVACRLSADGTVLSVLYSDRSLFVWSIKEPRKVGRIRCLLAHACCVWSICPLPTIHDSLEPHLLPEGTFATCSADNTIRLWNINGVQTNVNGQNGDAAANGNVEDALGATLKNSSGSIYMKELSRIIYVGNDFRNMKASSAESNVYDVCAPAECGIRSIKCSPDGHYIASGDRQGTLRVHDLTEDSKLVVSQDAHDAEIMSIDWSAPVDSDSCFLATGSRDRLIHLFDVQKGYEAKQTLDDHSSSITAVRFAARGSKLLSSSADKSVVFRSLNSSGGAYVRYHQAIVPYGTIYDMDVDPLQRYVVTSGQDKRLNIWNIATGKSVRSYKSDADAGEPLKIQLDPAGIYAATSCSDKSIRLFDFFSGECIAKVAGHSEVVTGVMFMRDCKRLVSASADGTIFVWKLRDDLTRVMLDRISELKRDYAQHMKQNIALPVPPPPSAGPATHQQKSPSPPAAEVESKSPQASPRRTQSLPSSPSRLSPPKPAKQNETRPTVPPSSSSVSEKQSESSSKSVSPPRRPTSPSHMSENAVSVSVHLFSETKLPAWAKAKVSVEGLPQAQADVVPKEEKRQTENIWGIRRDSSSVWAQRGGAAGYHIKSASEEDEPAAKVGLHRFAFDDEGEGDEKSPVHLLPVQGSVFARESTTTLVEESVGGSSEVDVAEGEEDVAEEEIEDDVDESTVYYDSKDEPASAPALPQANDRKSDAGFQVADNKGQASGADETPRSTSEETPRSTESGGVGGGGGGSEQSKHVHDTSLSDELGPFQDASQAEFLKVNFQNLDAESPSSRGHSARLSVSGRFLQGRGVDIAPRALIPLQEQNQHDDEEDDGPSVSLKAEREALKLKQRQEEMAREVERTRKRLADLGIVFKPKSHSTAPPNLPPTPAPSDQPRSFPPPKPHPIIYRPPPSASAPPSQQQQPHSG
eukprot:CAMPEP_0184651898 /NCGR_PEP_ID=MMETSP0308-20130426/9559_1 /TAXON_ID=38269 /ORGANISM="Gloeochaete witrockiana, Strain SAG 46.84" /LENGTH=1233 /DNA_ID=CAMNT_0027086439 /DNA_START=41 /DNA_END=3738 /DNA_ORIENTATION=-